MSVKLYANVELLEASDIDLSGYLPLTGGTLTGALLIHGGSNTLQLKVKGHSSQSASLQEWQSSAGAVLAKVASDGALTLGDSSDARTTIGPTANADGFHWGMRYANSAAGGGLLLGYMSQTISANGGTTTAFSFVLDTSVDSGKTHSSMVGLNYSLKKTGAGGLDYQRVSYYRAEVAGSGIVNYAYGVQARIDVTSSGYLQYGYGCHIDGAKVGGSSTFNRMYGLYVEDINYAAIDNYSIYTKAGDVRLMASSSDKIGFHGSTPVAQQTVTGSRGGNAALASLLTKLATLGLIVDSSS